MSRYREIGYWPNWIVMRKNEFDYRAKLRQDRIDKSLPVDEPNKWERIVFSEEERHTETNYYFKRFQGFISDEAKNKILKYISRSAVLVSYKGSADCRLCGICLGSRDMISQDGKWQFPEKYEHYIEEHNVVPSLDFIIDALKLINHQEYLDMLHDFAPWNYDVGDYFPDYEREVCLLAMNVLREKHGIIAMSHEIQRIWQIHSDDFDAGWLDVTPERLAEIIIALILLSKKQENSLDCDAAVIEACSITPTKNRGVGVAECGGGYYGLLLETPTNIPIEKKKYDSEVLP